MGRFLQIHSAVTRLGSVNVLRRFCLLVLLISAPLQAQRHPESSGPLKLYRDEPGLQITPSWKSRIPFVRQPRDRYERGRTRLFLNTADSVPYLNYAADRYYQWHRPGSRSSNSVRPRSNLPWDRMGAYVGAHARVFSVEESRGMDRLGTSFIDGNALRIGHYSYKALHWSATVGTEVRTRFTSLTLSQLRLGQARLDFNYRQGRDQTTLLYNRGRQSNLFSGWGELAGDTEERSPVLMYAGRWQHAFGNFARVGTTFLNQFQSFPSSSKADVWRGDLPYEMNAPRIIRVQITDDSPAETRAHAVVYNVHLIAEGERNGEPVRLTTIEGDKDFSQSLVEARRRSGGRFAGGGGWEAASDEAVTYEFSMPQDVTLRSARFIAEVAGDYRIGVRQEHDFNWTKPGDDEIFTESLLWPATPIGTEGRKAFKGDILSFDEEPFYTVRRAEGEGRITDTPQQVAFDYGMPTGQTIASIDWQADLEGLSLSGEIARNLQNYMYPVGTNEGRRSAQEAWAWWVKFLKDLPGGTQIGFEIFRLEPAYSGGYDSRRGGLPFHLDQQVGTTSRTVRSETQEFALVDDNDDGDQWPDESFNDQPNGGWPDSEVYPGLDADGDNAPDIDQNLNFVPDWQEPFLMYETDPPEFVYDIDLNNNGLPDFRENDDLPDYPYRRDQRGRHVFGRFNRLGGLARSLTVGYYNHREIANTGRAEAAYLRYAYDLQVPQWGQIDLDYDIKKVRDDIRDDSFIWVVPESQFHKINAMDGPPGLPGRERPSTPDLLLMRDSIVNTFYLDTALRRWDNLNIQNSMLLVRNDQAEIELDDGTGLLQEEDTRSHFTLINKIDYVWEWGPFTVHPKFKHLLQRDRIGSEDRPLRSYSDFIPILRADCAFTDHTRLLTGIQGFPLLAYKHWDRVDKDDAFDQRDYMFMVKISSEYWGYATTMSVGMHFTRREYSRLQERDIKNHRIFVDVYIGY